MNDRNIGKHNNHGKIKKLYFLRHIFLKKNDGSYKLCTKSILIILVYINLVFLITKCLITREETIYR